MSFLFLPESVSDWIRELKNKSIFFQKDMTEYSPYRQYLESKQWKAKRKRKLNQVGWCCESCGVAHQKGVILDVHHLTYERVTRERLSDLQVLCRPCHARRHGK